MKISVIMPVYNTKEEHLREAIESILNQTFQDFEFIIIDDGSEPYVKKTIETYKDKRIKYYYKKNEGTVAYARNYALSKCNGEYIANMDSDDISLPNRLEKQIEFLEKHKEYSGVSCSIETFPKKEIWHYPDMPCLLDCLKNSPIAHASAMFRNKDFKENKLFYNTSFCIGEDFDLWTNALKKGLLFKNEKQVLYKYRRENQGLTKIKQKYINKDTDKIKEDILYYLTKNNSKYVKKLKDMWLFPYTKKICFLSFPLMKIIRLENKTKFYLFGVKIYTKRGSE